MLTEYYQPAADLCLNILAEIERNYSSQDLARLLRDARKNVADDKNARFCAELPGDSRFDLTMMITHCKEALAAMEDLPNVAKKEGAPSTTQQHYKDLCRSAGEVLQIIGHFDLDLPGTMPPLVKRMMEEALPKLQRLGDEYVPSDNWLGSCQQFRAILSIAVDGARGLQQGISAYYSKATHRS